MRTVVKLATKFNNIFDKFYGRCYLRHNQKMSLISDESMQSSETDEHSDHIRKIQEFIPKLIPSKHKGQCGRVGVIGGSFEYTGAPYFAAMSSLRVGADVVHVFCCSEAGPVIKSYSPELIVHPILDSNDVIKLISPWIVKLHSVVIGPGLGRNSGVQKNVANIIGHLKKTVQSPPPLIIDADGLFLITEDPDIIKDYGAPIVLTPNSMEYSRLSLKMSETNGQNLALLLHAVLLQKGVTDIITNGIHSKSFADEHILMCNTPGSNRRCAGQGDILSGCIGTFIAWLQIYMTDNDVPVDFKKRSDTKRSIHFTESYMRYGLAAYAGCVVTRTCSKLAYELQGRGMTASDMLLQIGKAFKMNFGPFAGY